MEQQQKNFKERNGLELTSTHVCLPGETGDTQRHDGEHTIETSNGNHTGIVIELCIAITIFF